MTTPTHDSDNVVSMHPVTSDTRPNDKQRVLLMLELEASHARENNLIRDRDRLLERQTLLTQEFEHRLVNGLQVVASLLSLQSRTAGSPEAETQLRAAATRVAAIGRVHHRLHLLDHEESVAFKRYVTELCDDLTGLLLQEHETRSVVVLGVDVQLPVALGIPLGFIVNELVTNSVKYSDGNIAVTIASDDAIHSLTVSDEGPGLPPGFNPAVKVGLGMNILRSLVKQIGGSMHFSPGPGGKGTSVTVVFASENRAAG